MRASREGSRGSRSIALTIGQNHRAVAIFLAIFMIVAMIVGQAQMANAKDTNEIGADSSGSATVSSGGGSDSSGGATGGDQTGATDNGTVVRPSGETQVAAEKAQARREARQERKAERRQERRTAQREAGATMEAGATSGSGVKPILIDGNATCGSLVPGTDEVFRAEPVGGSGGGGGVSYTRNGDFLSWNSTLWIQAVFVKGGDGGDLYLYGSGAKGDTGLTPPYDPEHQKYYGFSHVSFCAGQPDYNPGIQVTKSCPAQARIGDKITYSITVKNTGDEDLVNVVVNDPLLGGNLGAFPGTLAPGESVTKTFDHTVTGNDPDPLTNTVTATGDGKYSDKSVSDSDSCDTDIVHEPGIDVTKSCPDSAKIGDEITYTITVTNTGDEPLESLKVEDTLLGDLSSSFPDTLGVGDSVTKTFKYTVTADGDPVHNEVTATAKGADSAKDVSDTATCDTDVQHEPGIDVTKSCTAEASVGDEITYSITVTNTGNEPLNDVKVIDTILGDLSSSFPDTLGVGDSVTKTFTYTVTANDPDPLHNVVTASGEGADSGETVSAQDECDTDIVHQPGIDVSKSCTAAANIGDEITYSITVTNTGDEPLNDVKVEDSLLGDLSGSYPDTLAVGESVTKTFKHTVTANDPDPLPNEVTASGVGADSEKKATDSDSCETDILHNPGIEVTKSCPAEVAVGGTITYTITVKNTGDEPLENVVVNDPLLGGDLAGFPTTLAVGQSVSKDFQYTTSANDPDPLPNSVTADGTGVDSAKDVNSSDGCETDILHQPGIDVTKSCPTSAKPGDEITYSITVTNTGNEPLNDVKVQDTLLGDLSGSFPNTLGVGDSVTKTFDYTVKDDVDPVHNEVTATGTGADSGTEVEDTASCDTDVQHEPGIDVTKSCPAAAHEGDTITYNITVTNTGNEPLENVVVNDPLLGGDLAGFPTTLAVGQTVTKSFDYTIPADTGSLSNEVSASGIGADSQGEVADTDSCDTAVHHPAIQIDKTVNPISGAPGDTVTYTYLVTNIGDVTLYDIHVTDDILGNIGTIPSLAPGATHTLYKDYVLPNTDQPTAIVNVATAAGCDEDNHCVSDDDDAVVTVVLGEREHNRQPPKGKVERGGVLPFTGSPAGMLILVIGVLTLAGVALNLISRRRREEA